MSTETNTPLDATQVQAARARYAVALQRYAGHQLGSAAAQAPDILAAVWKSFQEQPAVEIAGELAGEWLFLQCRRKIHALTQGGGSNKHAEAGGAEGENHPGKAQVENDESEAPHVTMQRLIERLTPKQQEVVRLRFQHDFSVQAVARITELTSYNVGGLVHNALAKLARGFRAQHPDESGTAGKGVGIDARLTLYALGEMESDERTAFEDSLIDKKNAGLRVEEIRTIGALIGQALAIAAGAPAPRTVRKNKRGGLALWLGFPRVLILLAAGLVTAAAIFLWLKQLAESPRSAPRSKVDFTLKPADWKVGEAVPEEARGRVGGGEGGFGGVNGTGTKFRNGSKTYSPVAVRATGTNPPAQSGNHSPDASRSSPTATAPNAESSEEVPVEEEEESSDGITTGPVQGGVAAVNRGKHGDPQAVAPAVPTGKEGEVETPPAQTQTDPEEMNPAAGDHGNPPAGKSAPKEKARAKAKPAAAPKNVTKRTEKPFVSPAEAAVSRLAPDVPVASVARLKQALRDGRWPAPNSVKVEELINYFPPASAAPTGADLFAATLETTEAPWDARKRLVRVSLKGKAAPVAARGAASLVLLVDVSGSMEAANRLPLVKEAVRLLLARLRPDDRVGLVTYAAEPKLALVPTPVAETPAILQVLEGLEAKGPTNGGAGLELAYTLARDHGVPGGKTCVIMCTDGDFNSGPTREEELGKIVDSQQDTGVKLSIYGFGRGRQIDVRLEKLALRGGGSSGYVNTRREAEQVLAGEINGIFAPLAQELELKVSFNPDQVEGYRLLGYDEESTGAAEKKPGSPGSRAMLPGQAFTALYEVVPKPGAPAAGDLLGLQLNYLTPEDGAAREQTFALRDRGLRFAQAGVDFKFAAAVGVFGLALRGQAPEGMTLDLVEAWAQETLGNDEGGYRSEFLALVREAKAARPE